MRVRRRRARGAWRLAFALCAALALVLLAPLAPVGALASTDTPADPTLVARIFEAFAVRRDAEAIAPVARAQLLRASGASRHDREVLARIVARGFAADRLERTAQHAFLEGFRLDFARRSARWLARPEAIALNAALRDASPRRCAAGDPSAPRARVLARIESLTFGVRRAPGLASMVRGRMHRVADSAWPATDSQLLQSLRSAGAARGYSCRFQAISTAELVEALAFIESDAGRWLYHGMERAWRRALDEAARRTALELIEHFEGRGRGAPLRVAGSAAAG